MAEDFLSGKGVTQEIEKFVDAAIYEIRHDAVVAIGDGARSFGHWRFSCTRSSKIRHCCAVSGNPYCKNLTLSGWLNNRQVIAVSVKAAVVAKILRGINAGKIAEIVNEMSLIVIAAIGCDVAPADRLSDGDFFQDGLEPAHAAEKFGRYADMLLEKFDEPASAEAGFVGDLRDS